MAKKHIVEIGYIKFGFDSIKAATDLITILSKAVQVDYDFDSGKGGYIPAKDDRLKDIELKFSQEFTPAQKPKAEKPLALPKPKRGTILCICEKSSVAPGQICAHCGRTFSESHNRTHGTDSHPKLRLV